MLHAARHDEELAAFEPHLAIAELHSESPIDDQKQLVLTVVVVPDELALELDELDVLTVQLADDARIPVVGELESFEAIDTFSMKPILAATPSNNHEGTTTRRHTG